MTDKPKPIDNNEENEAPATPQIEPEPEGGPLERQREFLAERISRLGPKDTEAEEAAVMRAAPPTIPGETPAPPIAELQFPPNRRLDLIEQYRRRQRTQRGMPDSARTSEAGEEQPDDATEESAAGSSASPQPPPPEPPLPPPANNWILIGPSVLRRGQAATQPATSGRTVGIAVAPGGTRVYIASANGGVWRSTDTGETWQSLMNAFDLNPQSQASDSLACGAIALVPGSLPSQDRIYVGSGEGAGAAYFGVGPIVSTDGGANWNTEATAPGDPPLAGQAFYALAVDPNNVERVIGGTRSGVYRREPDAAGGFHWQRKNLPGASTPVGFAGPIGTSVVAAFAGGVTTFYAATWFGPVFTSTDGHTWNPVGTGFPTTNVGRIGLAIQPNNPTIVYALIHDSSNNAILGVWRLDTGDNTWCQVTGHPPFLFGNPDPMISPGTQGSYDLAINVDPNNVNRIYLGGSTVLSGGAWSGAVYRGNVTSSGSGASLTYSMATTYIGASVHADIHTIVFAPGDSNKLWVGCDGGVFYSTNPTGTGNLFVPRNTGLATLTMEYLAQHPTEDAVVFCGSQDNGGARFTGEEAWLHSVWGDSGFSVINWNNPYKVVSTYVRASINRTTDGGTRYNYSAVDVPLSAGEQVLFYAPLVGTPYKPGTPAEAERIAFGSSRPWISDTFGGGWQSLPNNTTGDVLGAGGGFRIKSMIFATYTKLYVGLMNGRVYRYDQAGASWTRTRLDNMGGSSALPLAGVVTDIAVDPADATGNTIYITFGGSGDYRHVWHFDGAQWTQRSGPAAGHVNSLLDVHLSAIVVDPVNTTHVYVGADIGIWRSTDGGATWSPFSSGLPDAAILDLKLHNGQRLLRAATHGRGVFERRLDTDTAQGIELYVRDTQLDQGRFTTVNGLADPTNLGANVVHYRGPDIKLDTPDAMGQYQFPLTGTINFHDFVDVLSDDARMVATHATATIITRAYVQVHNRGVTPADNVQVMLLLANASAGLPALPPNYWINVQNGIPINTVDWQTLGIEILSDVRVGSPKIAAFDLSSSMLPPPASLGGNDHHCVLALIHHNDDPYTSTITNTDSNSRQERKAAHKNLKVIQFIGTLPTPPPIVIPVRIHNANIEERLLTRLLIRLYGYRARVRLFIPPLKIDGPIEEAIEGLFLEQDFAAFESWAEEHITMIERNQASEHPYHKEWSSQRVKDIGQARETGFMLVAANRKEISLHRIVMEPWSYHTIFLMLDRPENGEIGETFKIAILQLDQEKGELIGGLDTRVELAPEPELTRYYLRLWMQKWFLRGYLIRAQLHDSNGNSLTPEEALEITMVVQTSDGVVKNLGNMHWHKGWKSYYYIVRSLTARTDTRLIATAWLHSNKVAEAEISL